jgi:hypothetical protein
VQSNDISETLKHINTIEVQMLKEYCMDTISCGALLSRILGIIDLIEGETENFSEMLFWLKAITVSTNEMDGIVKKLLKKQSIEKKRIR